MYSSTTSRLKIYNLSYTRQKVCNPPCVPGSTSESGRSTPVTVSSVCSSTSGLPIHPLPPAPDAPHRTPSSTSSASQQSLLSSLGRQLSHDLAHWTLLPLPHRLPGTAILLYGPIHLLRLFGQCPKCGVARHDILFVR